MEIIRAQDFIETCQQSQDPEKRARGRNVRLALGKIRSDVEIVLEGAPPQALAFVHANKDKIAYLNYDVTADGATTNHALIHEDLHNRLQFWDLPVPSTFTAEHSAILEAACGFSLLDSGDNTGLMEGFHELLTIEQTGVDAEVAYNYRVVPAAHKLNQLSRKTLGISLLDIYKSGNHERLAQTLKSLADKCLLYKAAMDPDKQALRPQLEAKIASHTGEVANAAEAQEIVDAYEAEILLENLSASSPNSSHALAA